MPYENYWRPRVLNTRQKLFLSTIMERGFYVALKVSGYEKKYGYKILRHPMAKGYQLSLLTEAMKDINMTLGDLVKERFNLAKHIDTPPKIKDDILKDLIGYFENKGETAQTIQKMLKPSKEIKEAEVVK